MPGRRFNLLVLGILVTTRSFAGQLVSTEDPTTFFTTVASRLLSAEMGVNLARIQIFPTNEYTPQLHRLLQLTANLYECTTNQPTTDYPWLPRVYQPCFTNDAGTIFICGYQEASGTNVLHKPLRDLSVAVDREALGTCDRVRGIPLIIGTRKGFPNFNELAGETVITVARKLEFRRQSHNDSEIAETNVMYLLSVTNQFGLECFNSYRSAFPRDLLLSARMQVRVHMTNEWGIELISETNHFHSLIPVPAGTWQGYVGGGFDSRGFLVPISNHWTTLPLSTYSQMESQFVPVTGNFESLRRFPLPKWHVQLRVSCEYALIDTTAGALVDYVSLDSTTRSYDIATMLMLDPNMNLACKPYGPYMPSGSAEAVWCTNRFYPVEVCPTYGMLSQMAVGLGHVSSPFWPAQTNLLSINFFRTQFGLGPLTYGDYSKTNIFTCPFTPVRKVYLFTSWSANDPLVHYTLWDLAEANSEWHFAGHISRVPNLGKTNNRYEPWLEDGWTPTAWDPALKDSGVYSSDDWDFPQNQKPDLSWVAGVHRGTPWQTVYWKSRTVEPNTWFRWLPSSGPSDSTPLMPTNDWRLADILAPLFNTNFPYHLASANQPTAAGYQALLDGMTVYINPTNTITLSADSPEVADIGVALQNARTSRQGGYFNSIADLLAVPALSFNSPLLYFDPFTTPSDAAYEAIPSQFAGRIRPDSIGSVEGSKIRFTGLSDYHYKLEESTNMLNWIPVPGVAPAKGVVEIEMPQPEGGQKFYRTILLNSE